MNYEPDQLLIYFANQNNERIFYRHGTQWYDSWVRVFIKINEKYLISKIIGNFVIAKYQDGQAFIIEMKNEETVLEVQLGDKEIWNYEIDADSRLQSFCIMYKKKDKDFFWQQFDYQQQFHLTQNGTLEQVCSGNLIRITKIGAKIEIKQELSKFEDAFYEFQTVEFNGLPITVSSFTPYHIPGHRKLIFLVINAKMMFRKKIKPQYFVILDCHLLKAQVCELEQNN